MVNRRVTALVAVAVLCACASDSPSGPVSSVSLGASTLALVGIGSRGTLTAIVHASSGLVGDPVVSWISTNTSVATIEGTGALATVTAVGGGVAGIVATSGGKSAETTVSVTPSFVLSVTAAGDGSGVVSSAPAGISCTITGAATSGACAVKFALGTVVTLAAVSSAGNLFTGWTIGPCPTATGTCAVTIDEARSVVAGFMNLCATTKPYALGASVTDTLVQFSCTQGGPPVTQYQFTVSAQTTFTMSATSPTFSARVIPLGSEVLWWFSTAARAGADAVANVVAAPGSYTAFAGSATNGSIGGVTLSSTVNPVLACEQVFATRGVTIGGSLSSTCSTYLPTGLTGLAYARLIFLIVPAGHRLTAALSASAFSPVIEIREVNGTVLASTAGNAAGPTASIAYSALTSRAVILYITSRTPLGTGAYTLQIDP